MVDFTRKESVRDLTERVRGAQSGRERVSLLVGSMSQRLRALADRIGDMKADSIKQHEIDALKREITESANEFDAGSNGLSDATVGTRLGGAGVGSLQAGVGTSNLDSGPGQGPGANIDPDLGGPKGGPGQFAGNAGGPRGSDNPPDQPRRDQLGDATPGRTQPNPANPVPLPPANKAKPLGGTTPEERAAAEDRVADQQNDQRNQPKPAYDPNAPKEYQDHDRNRRAPR